MIREEFTNIVEQEFSALKSLYFNAAYFGPSPKRAQKKIDFTRKRIANPSFLPYEEWLSVPERMRLKFSQLLGCSPDNISHSSATCDVMTTIAQGLRLKENDLVVSCGGDYPSNVLPWMFAQKQGRLKFQMLEAPLLPDADWLRDNLPKETKVFDISLVAFNTGRKIDLYSIGKLLKERDIFFIVDATQSFGGETISRKELKLIDAISFSTYKWLLGPYGHAFAYYSDNLLKSMDPINASWINSPTFQGSNRLLDYTLETLPGARQFDRGQAPNMLTMAGLEGSLDLFLELGLAEVEKHNQKLVSFFLENFSSEKFRIVTPLEGHGNIICLHTDEDTEEIRRKLQKKKIDISVREGYLRISFHLYNNINQIELLLKILN